MDICKVGTQDEIITYGPLSFERQYRKSIQPSTIRKQDYGVQIKMLKVLVRVLLKISSS